MANIFIDSDLVLLTEDTSGIVTLPAGSQSGDIAVIFDVTSAINLISISDGFTQIVAEETTTTRVRAFYKVITGSEGNITLSYDTTTNGVIYLLVFRNTLASGWSETDTAREGFGTSNLTTSISTNSKGLAVVFFAGADALGIGLHSTASGYTEKYDFGVDATTDRFASVQYKLSCGTSESPSSTCSITADYLCGVLVYLEPTLISTGNMLGISI